MKSGLSEICKNFKKMSKKKIREILNYSNYDTILKKLPKILKTNTKSNNKINDLIFCFFLIDYTG